jgi:AcrR family transcriptional regulator
MSSRTKKLLLMSREEAIAKILKVFRQYGYEGTTLSRLSKATGLGKASLYHYFPNGKEEMAQAVLDFIDEWMRVNILMPLRGSGTPSDRLQAMSKNVDRLYCGGEQTCILAVLSLGEAKDLFHSQIQHALKSWIDTLAEVLVAADIEPTLARQRAEDAIIQIQGSLVLARGLDDTTPFQRVLKRLPEMLLGSGEWGVGSEE